MREGACQHSKSHDFVNFEFPFHLASYAVPIRVGQNVFEICDFHGTILYYPSSCRTEVVVNKKIRAEIEKIEENQDKLRESIEQTKDLAEQADKLLKQHKKTLKDQADD